MEAKILGELQQASVKLTKMFEFLRDSEKKKVSNIKILWGHYQQFKKSEQIEQMRNLIKNILDENLFLLTVLQQASRSVLALPEVFKKFTAGLPLQSLAAYQSLPIIQFYTKLGAFKKTLDQIITLLEDENRFFEEIITKYKAVIWDVPQPQVEQLIKHVLQLKQDAEKSLKNYELIIPAAAEEFESLLHFDSKFAPKKQNQFNIQEIKKFSVASEADLNKRLGIGKPKEVNPALLHVQIGPLIGKGGEKIVFAGLVSSDKYDKHKTAQVAVGFFREYYENNESDPSETERSNLMLATLMRLSRTTYLEGIARPKAVVFAGPDKPIIITEWFKYFGTSKIQEWMKTNDPMKVIGFFIRLFYECSQYGIFCNDAHPGNTGITAAGKVKSADAGLLATIRYGMVYTLKYMPLGFVTAMQAERARVSKRNSHHVVADVINMGILYWCLADVGLKNDATVFTLPSQVNKEIAEAKKNRQKIMETFRKSRLITKATIESKTGLTLSALIPTGETPLAEHLAQHAESFKKLELFYSTDMLEIMQGPAKLLLVKLLSYLTPYAFEYEFVNKEIPSFADLLVTIPQLEGNKIVGTLLAAAGYLEGSLQPVKILEEQVVCSKIGEALTNDEEAERRGKVMQNFYTPLADIRFSDEFEILHQNNSSELTKLKQSIELRTLSPQFIKLTLIVGAYAMIGEMKNETAHPVLQYMKPYIGLYYLMNEQELIKIMEHYGLEQQQLMYVKKGIEVLSQSHIDTSAG